MIKTWIKIVCSSLITIISIFVFVASGECIVIGDTNLGILGYPDHTCGYPPTKPIPPFSDDRFSVESYNSRVRSYNIEIDTFYYCIKRYLDAAKNDIERIKEKMQDAIDAYNRVY